MEGIMLKIERDSVMNLENAMRGARNPMNSWAKSDSYYDEDGEYVYGPVDLEFGSRLPRRIITVRICAPDGSICRQIGWSIIRSGGCKIFDLYSFSQLFKRCSKFAPVRQTSRGNHGYTADFFRKNNIKSVVHK